MRNVILIILTRKCHLWDLERPHSDDGDDNGDASGGSSCARRKEEEEEVEAKAG